jgi:hypothetical protein
MRNIYVGGKEQIIAVMERKYHLYVPEM